MLHDLSWLGPFCAFVSSVTWAIGSTQYSKLARTNSPFAVNFTRALLALPLFVLTAVIQFRGLDGFALLRPEHLGWFTLSVLGGFALGDALFLFSSQRLGVPGALAIASSYPLWTTLAGIVFRDQPVSALQGAGVALAVAGVMLVILSDPGNAPAGQPPREGLAPAGQPRSNSRLVGSLLALGTSALWTLNSFAVSVGSADLPAPVASTVRMLLALLMCAAMGRLLAPRAPLVLPAHAIRGLWWVFVFEAFVGSLCFVYGLGHSPLVLGSTLTSLAPVLSLPVAWMLGLERFSLPRTLGVAAVVAGLVFLVLAG